MMESSIQRCPGKHPCSPTLVLLHGWGYHKSAWPESWLQNLAEHYDLLLVDLPGHGDDSCHELADSDLSVLDIWLQRLGTSLPAQYSLLGWSLGGQIAMRLAQQQPDRVQRLVCLANNLSFVQREGWSDAMPEQVFTQFQTAFARLPEKTLQRFCALQAQGSEDPMAMTKLLRTQVHCRPSLAMGLDWLARLDLRETWLQITCPALLPLAEQDALVPASVVAAIKLLSTQNQETYVLAGSHAMTWEQSTEERLLSRVTEFLEADHV